MAEKHNLEHDWLNDGVKGFLTEKMSFDKHLSFSNLQVYNVNAEGLLAMKLTSARPRSQDMNDSVFLMKALGITKQEQLFDIMEKYTHPKQQSIASKYFAIEAFNRHQQERATPQQQNQKPNNENRSEDEGDFLMPKNGSIEVEILIDDRLENNWVSGKIGDSVTFGAMVSPVDLENGIDGARFQNFLSMSISNIGL